MHSLAPYRPLGLNSRTPGICPPSPRHPPRHCNRSRLSYTRLLVAAAVSMTPPTPIPAVVVAIPPLRLLKQHIPASPKGGDFIAGRVQTAMTIVHHACVCHRRGKDSLRVERDRKRPRPLLLMTKGLLLSSLRLNADFDLLECRFCFCCMSLTY